MKIIYCGFGRAGMECLDQLLLHPEVSPDQILVFSHDRDDNRQFIRHVRNLGISLHLKNINRQIDLVSAFKPDLLVSVYYRYIIKEPLLDLVNYRAMNLHPSLLPDYRGCFSSAWAILNGDTETGITFHLMDHDIDTGNILYQERVPIKESDTCYVLYYKLVAAFVRKFLNVFTAFANGDTGHAQQADGRSRYYGRSVPYDGALDASSTTYEEAARFVRAMYYPPFSPAEFVCRGEKITCESVEKLKDLKHFFKQE